MSLHGGWRNAAAALGLGLGFGLPVASVNAASWSWLKDPFKIEHKTSPAPETRWEPAGPLPEVKVPPTAAPLPSAQALTLPELTEYALRNNPRTRQAWYAARAAASSLGVVLGDDLPLITGSYNVVRVHPVSGTTGLISPWINRWGGQISFNYVLYDFGAGDDKVEAAEYRLLAANLAQNRVLQEVVFQVEQAYYQLIGIEALGRVNEQSVKNTETVLDAVRRRRESGLATVADVYRSETQVAQAQLILARSRGELEKARGQLATVVGLPLNSSIRVQTLSAPPQTTQAVAAITDYLERVKSSRPDLVAAEAQARAARATANAASKAGLPSIEINGVFQSSQWARHGIFTTDTARPPTLASNLALNVRIPIFSGFKDTYTVRQSEMQAQQAEAVRDSLFRQTQLEVWQSYYDLQTVRGSINSTELLVRSAEQTAEATIARYRGGFGTILDLITAQQDETNARTQRIQSYLDWYTVLARLHFFVGASDLITTKTEKK